MDNRVSSIANLIPCLIMKTQARLRQVTNKDTQPGGSKNPAIRRTAKRPLKSLDSDLNALSSPDMNERANTFKSQRVIGYILPYETRGACHQDGGLA